MPAIDTQKGRKARPRRSSPGPPSFPSYVPPRPGAIKPRPKPRPAPKSSSGVAPNFPRYVPKRPAATPPPRPTQIAHAQEQQYHSQAGAVRRAAATQKVHGPGVAVRPPKGARQVLTAQLIANAGTQRRGTSPVGDRPQGRAQEMARTPSYRAMFKDPNTGRTISTLKTPAAPRGAQQRGTSPVGDRPQGRAKEMREAPTHARVGKGRGPGTTFATISPTKLAGKYAAALAWKDPRGASLGGGLGDISKNAILDAGELGITMPTTIGHLAVRQAGAAVKSAKTGSVKPLVKAEVQTAKELAQPYIELAKHPRKAVTEHPVGTALMLAPTVKVPARFAGRAAAKTGVSSLAKEPATLPGTSMKAQRWQSPDVLERAVAPHRVPASKRPKGPTISDDEIKTRTDEAWDAAQLHKQVVEHSAGKEANERFGHLPKAERDAKVQEHMSGARGGAQQEATRRFAREMGSHWRVAAQPPKVTRKLAGQKTYKAKAGPELPSRADYIAGRPKPSRGSPEPTVAALTENVKPGKPGLHIEDEHIRQVDRQTREQTGWGRRVPGGVDDKVIVVRDNAGKPIGAMKLTGGKGKDLIIEVAVDPAHRGKGIAMQMAKAAHDAGYDVAGAARAGGLTEAGAAFTHKALTAKGELEQPFKIKVRKYTHETTPRPELIVKPKNPSEDSGVLHDSKADAEKIAERVPFDAKVIDVESPSKTQYAVVPRAAAERWAWHGRVGHSPAAGAVTARVLTRLFRRSVLPLSTKWLGGQAGEAGIRAAVMGAGPTSYLRARRLLKAMPEKERRELLNRTVQGGQFGVTGPAKEFARGQEKTLAEEYAGTGPRLERLAERATAAGAKPGIRHLRGGYRRYSEIVFNDVNGTIERMAKTAMLGKAVKQSPLLEKSLMRLSDKAVEEAAAGMRNTSTMVELGRGLDRAYGRYSKFSPAAREMMMHSTPFAPWFVNMTKFLTSVMPKDHPVVTALAASASQADEEWRKQHRLSLRGKDRVPDFMLGSVPKGKKFVPVGRFGPFLPGEYTSAAGGQFLPYFQGMLMNAAGVDWTGREMKGFAGTQPGLAANAALTGAETFIPGLSQLDRITGLGEHYVRGKTEKKSVAQGKEIKQSVLDMLNPLKATGEKSKKGKKKQAAGGGYPGFGGTGESGYAGF